jgi:regulator of protease activity HflC (stomatin/prohibitin superfamily)
MFAYKVNEKEAVILERMGEFKKVVDQPGLHGKMPGKFLKVAARIQLSITAHDFSLETKTKDNIFTSVPTTLHLQVVDPKKFHYTAKGGDPYEQAGSKIIQAMKQLTSGMEFDQLYQVRETLGNDVREKVGKDIEDYGLKIIDVIVDQPVAPDSVQKAYNSAKSSEQLAIGTLNAAQANKQSSIMDAEARKEALRLDGEGVAEQRQAMFKNLSDQYNVLVQAGMPPTTAEKMIIKMMELDTLRDVGKNGNVIVTTTADRDSAITDMQTASRSLQKVQPKQPPAPGQ